MGKILSRRVAGPDDPMFKEPVRSYNPQWARALLKQTPAKAKIDPPSAGETDSEKEDAR